MQKQITMQLQALRKAEALRTLPTGPLYTGGALNPLDIHDVARRRQGLINAACRGICAWLAANSSTSNDITLTLIAITNIDEL